MGWRRRAQMHIAQKFEGLLEMYRRPDGRRWSGQEIDEATGGIVTRSYITNLLAEGQDRKPWFREVESHSQGHGLSSGVVVRGESSSQGWVAYRLRAWTPERRREDQPALRSHKERDDR